jgi:hypothetical protein
MQDFHSRMAVIQIKTFIKHNNKIEYKIKQYELLYIYIYLIIPVIKSWLLTMQTLVQSWMTFGV